MNNLQVIENSKEYSLEEKKIAMEISDLIAGYHIDLDPETEGAIRDDVFTNGHWFTKNIVGKMLTLIDSVIEDKERRDAIKSLARQLIQEEREQIVDTIYKRYKNY